MSIGISPFATHFKSWLREISVQPRGFTFDGNFLHPLPVIRPIWMPVYAKYFINDSKCCSARISVGTMYATWRFPKSFPSGLELITAKAAPAATAVFPLPTSPSRSRDIGCLLLKSERMLLIDLAWAEVRGK